MCFIGVGEYYGGIKLFKLVKCWAKRCIGSDRTKSMGTPPMVVRLSKLGFLLSVYVYVYAVADAMHSCYLKNLKAICQFLATEHNSHIAEGR